MQPSRNYFGRLLLSQLSVWLWFPDWESAASFSRWWSRRATPCPACAARRSPPEPPRSSLARGDVDVCAASRSACVDRCVCVCVCHVIVSDQPCSQEKTSKFTTALENKCRFFRRILWQLLLRIKSMLLWRQECIIASGLSLLEFTHYTNFVVMAVITRLIYERQLFEVCEIRKQHYVRVHWRSRIDYRSFFKNCSKLADNSMFHDDIAVLWTESWLWNSSS